MPGTQNTPELLTLLLFWPKHLSGKEAVYPHIFFCYVLEVTVGCKKPHFYLKVWKPLMLKLQYFGHVMWRADSLENTLTLERLKAGEEGDDRGWDGWMASLTQWTWVWVDSGSWWWTGRPGVLQFVGLQRVGHVWVTEQLPLNHREVVCRKLTIMASGAQASSLGGTTLSPAGQQFSSFGWPGDMAPGPPGLLKLRIQEVQGAPRY